MIRVIKRNTAVTAIMDGEIDHCCAGVYKDRIDDAIMDAGVRELRLDLSRVTFMDSSGVGMMIGRYRTMAQRGGRVVATGMNQQIERLFRFAGLHRIIALEKEGGEDANE